jgi:hypothetical protein
MTMSSMRFSLSRLFPHATIVWFREAGLLWIKSDRRRNPGLARIGRREVPLAAYVFEAAPPAIL